MPPRKRTNEQRLDTIDKETIAAAAVMATDIRYIKESIEKLVTKDEFNPVRNLVYGFASLILVAFAGAVIAFFISAPRAMGAVREKPVLVSVATAEVSASTQEQTVEIPSVEIPSLPELPTVPNIFEAASPLIRSVDELLGILAP